MRLPVIIKELSSSELGAGASSHLNEAGDRTKAAVDNLSMDQQENDK